MLTNYSLENIKLLPNDQHNFKDVTNHLTQIILNNDRSENYDLEKDYLKNTNDDRYNYYDNDIINVVAVCILFY